MEEVIELLSLIKGYYDELDALNRDRAAAGLQPTTIRERIHVWNPSIYDGPDEELPETVTRLQQHLERTRALIQSSRQELNIHTPTEEGKTITPVPTPGCPCSAASGDHTIWFLLAVGFFLYRKLKK